jgi:hypothetical protein
VIDGIETAALDGREEIRDERFDKSTANPYACYEVSRKRTNIE